MTFVTKVGDLEWWKPSSRQILVAKYDSQLRSTNHQDQPLWHRVAELGRGVFFHVFGVGKKGANIQNKSNLGVDLGAKGPVAPYKRREGEDKPLIWLHTGF